MQRFITNRVIIIALMWMVIAFVLSILPDSELLTSALNPSNSDARPAQISVATAPRTTH